MISEIPCINCERPSHYVLLYQNPANKQSWTVIRRIHHETHYVIAPSTYCNNSWCISNISPNHLYPVDIFKDKKVLEILESLNQCYQVIYD